MKLLMSAMALSCLGIGYFEGTPIMFVPVAVALVGLIFMELADRTRPRPER